MPILVKKGSAPLSVSTAKAYEDAIADGYTLRGDKAALTSRRGDTVEVDPENVQHFLDTNHAPEQSSDAQARRIGQERENEFGGTAERVRTFGENVASGVTLGASDLIMDQVFDSGEDIKNRREVNPGTAMAGQVTGAVGGALIPGAGATGVVGKIARNTPAGLAARGAAKLGVKAGGGLKGAAAAGGFEGALHGAGQGVSNLAINDVPLSVESVVSEVGLNALIGGGLGGIAGAGGWAVGKAGSKLAQRGKGKLLADSVDLSQETLGSFKQAATRTFKDIDDIAPSVLKRAENFNKGFKDGIDDVAFTNAVNVLDDAANSAIAKATNLGKYTHQVKAIQKAEGAMVGADDIVKPAFRKYQEAVRQLSKSVGQPTGALNALRITSRTPLVAPEGLDDLLMAARKSQKAIGEGSNPLDTLLKTDSVDDMMRVAKDLTDYGTNMKALDAAVEGGFTKSFDDSLLKLSAQAKELVGPQAEGVNLLAMGALFGIEETLIPDLPGPIDDIVKAALAIKFAGKFAAGGKQGGNALMNLVGQAARVAGRSGGRGVPGNQVARAVSATVAGTRNIATATRNATSRLQVAFGKLGSMSGKAVRKAGPSASRALLADFDLFGNKPEGKETEAAAFKRVTHDIAKLASDPYATQKRVSKNAAPLRAGNLAVGDQMAVHLSSVVDFLNQHMPRDPGRLKQFGQSRWRPTPNEQHKFTQLVAAVNDPVSAVEALADGTMNRQQALALRQVHPAMFQQVQNYLVDNLDNLQNLPYRQRIQISTLMGVDADPVVSRTKEWQANFQSDAAQEGGIQKPSGSTAPTDPDTLAQQLSAPRSL